MSITLDTPQPAQDVVVPTFDHFDCPMFRVDLPPDGPRITNAMNAMRLQRAADGSVVLDAAGLPLVVDGSLVNLANDPVYAGAGAQEVIGAAGVRTVLAALVGLADTMTVADARTYLSTQDGATVAGAAIYKGIADAIYAADVRVPKT